MEYTVSKKHRDAVAALTGDARVKKALDFLKEDHERCVREQVTITKISSPTFHEEKRAAYMTEHDIESAIKIAREAMENAARELDFAAAAAYRDQMYALQEKQQNLKKK